MTQTLRRTIIATLCTWWLVTAAEVRLEGPTAGTPEHLPDGVLVTGGDDTRNHVATWTVLVTLEAPRGEPRLLDKLRGFRETLRSHHELNALSNITREIWEQRIREIESTMTTVAPGDVRVRRGLLDIIGDISNKLFGIATEQEVMESRVRIASVRKSNRRISHLVNKLVTIINQTHDQVKQNSKHIREFDQYIALVEREIHIIRVKMQGRVEEIDRLKSTVETDRVLSAIEAAHNNWLRQVELYHRQRASLEMGRLTEDILPTKALIRILEQARRKNLYAPSAVWYYMNIRILPMWEDEQRLVFRAQLPLSDNLNYLRYHIWTWPVPGNDSSISVQLQVPNDIAFDTKTGGIFQPTACQGSKPAICRSGPIYDRSRLRCPRGVISGEDALRQKCRVTLTKTTEQTASVTELTPGTILVRTLGESYSMHCAGEAEKRGELPKGLHIIRLKPRCWTRGDGWTVAGLIHYNSEEHVTLPMIKIPPMTLTRAIRNKTINRHFERPHWQALGELRDIELSTLANDDDDDDDDYNDDINASGKYISWTTLALWVGMLMVVSYLAREMYRRNVLCKRNQPADVPTEAVEAEEDACGLMGRYMPRTTRHEDLHVCTAADDDDLQAAAAEKAAKLNELLNTTPIAWRKIIPAIIPGDKQGMQEQCTLHA